MSRPEEETTEAKRHTLSDLISRYRRDVLPHELAWTVYVQEQ